MKDCFIDDLRKIPLIDSIKQIHFSDIVGQISKPDTQAIACSNNSYLYAYKIKYWSQGHRVVGYIVVPRDYGRWPPAIIYNRGGTGEHFKIEDKDVFLRFARFVRKGFVIIASQYSGNDGSEGIDEVGGNDLEDVLVLYEILKALGIDRVSMIGGSRGGGMTYQAVASQDQNKEPWIKAAIILAGVSNYFRLKNNRPDLFEHIINHINPSQEELEKRSAVFWPEKLHPKTPILLIHGTADDFVSHDDTLQMALCISKTGRENFSLRLFEGADHMLANQRDSIYTLTNRYLDYYVTKLGKYPSKVGI